MNNGDTTVLAHVWDEIVASVGFLPLKILVSWAMLLNATAEWSDEGRQIMKSKAIPPLMKHPLDEYVVESKLLRIKQHDSLWLWHAKHVPPMRSNQGTPGERLGVELDEVHFTLSTSGVLKKCRRSCLSPIPSSSSLTTSQEKTEQPNRSHFLKESRHDLPRITSKIHQKHRTNLAIQRHW